MAVVCPRRSSVLRGSLGNSRGLSMSVLVSLLIPVLLMCAGLAVDGSAKTAADRRAEAVAAQAARAGMDAAAPLLVSGSGSAEVVAVLAAEQVIAAHAPVAGQAAIAPGGSLRVSTSTAVPTVFLGLAGLDHVTGRGSATVELRVR